MANLSCIAETDRVALLWDGLANWQPLGGDSLNGTSYMHTGLAAGTTYYYTIRAVNAAGERSDWLQEPYPSATVTDLKSPKQKAGPAERKILFEKDAGQERRRAVACTDRLQDKWNVIAVVAAIAIVETGGSGELHVGGQPERFVDCDDGTPAFGSVPALKTSAEVG